MGKIPWSKILTVGGSFVLGAVLGIGGMMLAGPGAGTTFAPQGLMQAGILNNNAEGDQKPTATADGPGERDDQTLNELGERPLADPALSNASEPNASEPNATEPSDSDAPSLINLTAAEQEKLFSDYKQALGTLFDAWRSTDIASFETKISEAYTGTLLEKHIQRAQGYIPQGTGLYIDEIDFGDIVLEAADAASATLRAGYSYMARDYDLEEHQVYGNRVRHEVHVRVNLIRLSDRWLISGESAI